jgi:phosphocarrier protein
MASGFRSSVSVTKNGCTVNGKSSIELLTLAAVRGSTIVVQVEGPDAECALTHLKSLVESNFGEE